MHVHMRTACTPWYPSTHFVYFIPIADKTAREVANAFVEKVLLEQGAPVSILTDNGSEFRNKFMCEVMMALEVEHQFTPAYHPRGNQTERVNRWFGETLRTIMNHRDVKKTDWPKFTKYLEFAYRMAPIPGTNICPFEAARGSKPKMPASLSLESKDGASTYKALEEVARQMAEHLNLANKLVKEALEKSRSKGQEEFNQKQVRIDFEVDELVRFWNRVPARKGQGPSKLKLRNAVYVVKGIRGQMVDLAERDTGALRTAHVSQLARFRAPEDAPKVPSNELSASTQDAQDKLWRKLDKGTKIVFHIKRDPASHLRVAEVLDFNADDRTVQVWFYVHAYGDYDPERPLAQWHATPEWYDGNNKGVVMPKPHMKEKLFMRDGDFTADQITLIAAGVSLQRGKLPDSVIDASDAWLARASMKDRRALRALSRSQSKDKG